MTNKLDFEYSDQAYNYELAVNIESILQKTIGSTSWLTDWVRQLCYEDSEFITFLQKQPNDVRHFLAFLKLGIDATPTDFSDVSHIVTLIRTKKRINLLKMIYETYPSGLDRVITKLSNTTLKQEYYRTITTILSQKNAVQEKRIFWNAKKISTNFINILFTLDKELWINPIIYKLKSKEEAEAYNYIVSFITSFFPKERHDEIVKSIKKYDSFELLDMWSRKWLKKADFSAPPWAGNEKVKPITSAKEMSRIGRKCDRPLISFIPHVHRGNDYFYIWEHESKAIVRITRKPFIGWSICKITGLKNIKIDRSLVEIIQNEFQSHGISEKLSIHNDHIKCFHTNLSGYGGW